MADPANDVYLSVASVWEIAVKHALAHGLTLLTPDPLISRYSVRTAW